MFKVTVADLADAGLDEKSVLDHAIKMLSQGGEVKFDIPHRIYKVYGRQLSILGADGTRSTVALFDYEGRLYQIDAQALPGNDNPIETLRFQQSLVFTDGGSNRSAETIDAIRQACRGSPKRPPTRPVSTIRAAVAAPRNGPFGESVTQAGARHCLQASRGINLID